MLDTTCSELVWRILATHSIRQFPLHFPSRSSPCAITYQLDSTSTSRQVKREIWDVLEATRSSQFLTDGEKFSSTVSFPLPKNKLRTNFWTEKSLPLLRLLPLLPDTVLIKSKSLVFICFFPFRLSFFTETFFIFSSSLCVCVCVCTYICWYLSLMMDGHHINFEPAVTIISINFPSYRDLLSCSAFHSENQIDEINEMKRTDRH